MKKTILFILFIALFLTACNAQMPQKANQNTQIIITQPETTSWKSYDKKYVTLSGIQYPSNFFIDDRSAIEIRSSEIPLIKNNECFFSNPCAEKGLMIVIGLTKPYGAEGLEDTKYPNIKRVNSEKAGIPPESIKDYNYRQYLYIAKNDQYVIQIYEKGFEGDSEAIVNSILGSLHE